MLVQPCKPTHEDIASVAPLFDAYRMGYGQSTDVDLAFGFLHDRLIRGESVVLIARAGDDNRGPVFGFVQLYPSFSSLAASRIWILNDLFVCPEFRRAGVARALMSAAREFASTTGATKVVLKTEANNIAAQELYGALGYVCENDTTKFYALDLEEPCSSPRAL